MGRVVGLGDWCIINVNDGGKYIVVQVKDDDSTVRILKKKRFPCKQLIGQQYGDYLEVDKAQNLQAWDRSKRLNLALKVEEEEYEKLSDNRNVKRNDPSVQTLTADDIEEMKKNDTVRGSEIIEKVKEANAGFQEKTLFSQEKYLIKKRKKHLSIIQIIKPTARTISEAYFNHGIQKIGYLRPDSVAQLLNLGNITSGDNVLVHETCAGLVIGAIAERLGGRGNLLSLYTEQVVPVNNALKCFNFPETIGNTYIPIPFHQLEPLANSSLEDFTSLPDSFVFRKSKDLELLRRARTVIDKPVDSLVIVTKYETPEVLLELFKYVRGSGHIVIFHQHLEPLIQCHEMLKDSGEAVCIELRETWFRDYQVLPMRTHPMMKMHGASGYLLSAVKVLYSNLVRPPKPNKNQGPQRGSKRPQQKQQKKQKVQ
uniref:tRNA (adenine(58)-N(1))-methyltransferase non-catalytic subunit TRM6 n=1 Tax=Vannella robusta TaxID=1487602 RepID=A0A7S4MKZ3_9EUKA|mmetsp:Transcript_25469/g.32429  ORF Transcript_25469/g.32429 Transcript_25469/m.32429 type:complete len:426 (+) Transcript_25469:503-1780(+)|eukprot:CAMPEP_0206197372 /NCGR_PEP_ID=MMETSP0166-20121206/9017_1 /ASSEMBLY_ACC=CAM_ASM_000260 /TAXON_ID=95228 /ORGANISM="Vannella robusta, Strain DIVA3 518/3/11/1/6" /LENGTH=425 /DNA_ID=CAMNT_0053615051 /DNA_START=464 /DNA_END=1741 /DNA_ORIENTATION=-